MRFEIFKTVCIEPHLFFFFSCKFQIIDDKILWKFLEVCLKFLTSPYAIFQTYGIIWSNFCSLFLNFVKKSKRKGTQNCPNGIFSIILPLIVAYSLIFSNAFSVYKKHFSHITKKLYGFKMHIFKALFS